MATQEQFCENCGASNIATARFCQYCATPLPFKHTTGTLPEQTLLNGRYQLDIRIGQGGMGAVYKAIDTRFNNRPIAIKEMSRAGLTEGRLEEAESAFEHEAQLLADLLHPNLPRIYDHFTEGERSYLVMDFIEGVTIEQQLEECQGKTLALEQVLDWGKQLCDVLNYLHTHQPPIIFRDLKPSNVMISGSGHVFLIDFGIARVFKPGQSHDTVALGSPGFAAPEQYGKAQSTPRSDIYSLGSLMHCLLTGVDPSEQPFFFQPASQLNPAVPLELEDLMSQMLQMNAELRPASAQDVVQTLRSIEQRRISGTLTPGSGKRPTVRPPSQAQQLLQEANRLYSLRRVRDALTVYDQTIRLDSTNPDAWQGRGLTLALRSLHAEALDSFERALQLDPNRTIALNGKGTALNMLHRNKEADRVFDYALLLDAKNAYSWNGKGAVLSALNQPEKALDAFDKALYFDANMAQAWGNKGWVLRQLRRYPQALEAFDKALELDSQAVPFWNGKGMVLYEMGRLQNAQRIFQEALSRSPNYAPALYGMANVLYAQRQLQNARETYTRAVQADPSLVRAWDKLGNLNADLKFYPEALKNYERALRVDPGYAPAWNGKANVLTRMENYPAALTAYNKALDLNSNAALAWNGRGNVYYQLGDFARALHDYAEALRLNPKMVSAHHNKSLVLRQMGHFEEALQAAETAIQLAPHDADNWLRKAEALRKLHRRKPAREAETEAARLSGGP